MPMKEKVYFTIIRAVIVDAQIKSNPKSSCCKELPIPAAPEYELAPAGPLLGVGVVGEEAPPLIAGVTMELNLVTCDVFSGTTSVPSQNALLPIPW